MERCTNCGKRIGNPQGRYDGDYCDGLMTMDVDPFAAEINDDFTLYLDCEGHRYESAMDI
jgi:hypothetical protein